MRAVPIAFLVLCLNLGLVIHAAKTGRFSTWGWIIIFLPLLRGLAYILVELVPELLGSPRAQKTQRTLAHSLNPEKTYRRLRDRLADADTVANRAEFAEECAALGKWQEA